MAGSRSRHQATLIDGSYTRSTVGDGDEDRRSMAARWRRQGRSGHPRAGDEGGGHDAEDFMGDVIGNLNGQGAARSTGSRARDEPRDSATRPLARVFGYATELRSMTQVGRVLDGSSATTRKYPPVSPPS